MSTSRKSEITRVSVIGIVTNIFLSAFKAVVGMLANSVAVLMDAVNNLSDALSSVITIVGVRLAGRKPDSKHPFGYGRVEYFSDMVIALIVFSAGAMALVESVKNILNPEQTDYSWISVLVIVVAVIAKFFLGRYVIHKGKQLSSDALVGSGTDALFDSILSASTLLAAGVSLIWNISIDGYVGALISIFIIKTGLELLVKPVGSMMGRRADGDLAKEIKDSVKEVPGVLGAYDLVLHDYGPSRAMGTVHVEVPDSMSAKEINRITKRIQNVIYERFDTILTVGIYATNDSDPSILAIKDFAASAAMEEEGVMQVHGFCADDSDLYMDMVVSFKVDAHEVVENVRKKLLSRYPSMTIHLNVDSDYSGDIEK